MKKVKALTLYGRITEEENLLSTHAAFSSDYADCRDRLNGLLRDIINSDDFCLISKERILHVLSLSSTYRPMEPFRILVEISNMYDKFIGIGGRI